MNPIRTALLVYALAAGVLLLGIAGVALAALGGSEELTGLFAGVVGAVIVLGVGSFVSRRRIS